MPALRDIIRKAHLSLGPNPDDTSRSLVVFAPKSFVANNPLIPDDLLRFLDANVDSIEQLEILRILGENRSKAWTESELATESQTRPALMFAHLSTLESRGLLKTYMDGGKKMCSYATNSSDLEEKLVRLLQLYRERPATLIRLVYARAHDRLSAFAEAFRLRKDT